MKDTTSAYRASHAEDGHNRKEVMYQGGGSLSREPLLSVCVPLWKGFV